MTLWTMVKYAGAFVLGMLRAVPGPVGRAFGWVADRVGGR